jgi:hypothetical protein
MVVYFLFRNTTMVLFDWFPCLVYLNRFFIRLSVNENIFLAIAFYSIPDGLWLLSGLCCIRVLWWTNQKNGVLYTAIFCLFALCFEVFQIFEAVPGTVDVVDIVVLFFFAFLESEMFKCFRRSML